MIDKKTFVEAISFIQERNELLDKILAVADGEFDFCINPHSKYESAYVDLLCKAVSDNYDATEDVLYFIYELDFGKRYTDGCITENGRIIDHGTAEKLYDFIKSKNERGNTNG